MTLPLSEFEPYVYFENGKILLSEDAPAELVSDFEKMMREFNKYTESRGSKIAQK